MRMRNTFPRHRLAGTFCGTAIALTDLVFSADAGTNSSIWRESISSVNESQTGQPGLNDDDCQQEERS
jgi:hypothetical protein